MTWTHQTGVKQSRFGSTDAASQRSNCEIMKLEAWSETNAGHKWEDNTLMRGMRNSIQTAPRYQSLEKRSMVENAQRKTMDSEFSTVKWRATETGINRRRALKSCSSEWIIEAKRYRRHTGSKKCGPPAVVPRGLQWLGSISFRFLDLPWGRNEAC